MTCRDCSGVGPSRIHWNLLLLQLPVRPAVRYDLNAEWSRLAVGNWRKPDCAHRLAVRAGQAALDKLLSIGPDSFHRTGMSVCVFVWQAQLHHVVLGTCSVIFCVNFSKVIKCLRFHRRGHSVHCLHLTYLRVPGKSHHFIPEWSHTESNKNIPMGCN
jgi:hypothetical protein